jgi:hypothetical protein
MKLEGFAYFGNKRHDLHMPYPLSETVGATEYYVAAGVNLTVTFRDGGDILAPKGFKVVYKNPVQLCNGASVVFSPKAGHDYEVREHGGGFCSAAVVELAPDAYGAARYIPVEASACPASF